MNTQIDVLIIGSGTCADAIPEALTAQGLQSATITSEQLTGCRGQIGGFQVKAGTNGKGSEYQAKAIVLTESPDCFPNHEAYHLTLSDQVISISQLEKVSAEGDLETLLSPQAQVLFLNDWETDPHPTVVARMLQSCLRLQTEGDCRTVYMAGNLKVAEDGMEACYQAAKAAGAQFFKFTDQPPMLAVQADGRIQVDYTDETMALPMQMTADLVVVDERVRPPEHLKRSADLLRLDQDSLGFLQSDNIHRLGHYTNRRGILVAAGARAIFSAAEQAADAQRVALQLSESIHGLEPRPLPAAVIDQGKCARCLTCYRLCPYAAIDMSPRMIIDAQACQSCGLCVAGCPNRAIQVDDPALAAALTALAEKTVSGSEHPAAPKLVAFCCRRSAAQARELALTMGQALPPGMIFVEGLCGGSFSVHHLLGAFEAGMDGVMVLTCHPGNCHAEQGTDFARTRSAEAARILQAMDIAPERIHYGTLAANMAAELAQTANAFSDKIAQLGAVVTPGEE